MSYLVNAAARAAQCSAYISGCRRTAREGGAQSRGGEGVDFKLQTTLGIKIHGRVNYFTRYFV
jgi:hypothetical protein